MKPFAHYFVILSALFPITFYAQCEEVNHFITKEKNRSFFMNKSPNPSGYIVFQSDRTGNEDIFLLNLNSGKLKQLTDHPGNDGYPIFSPDGKRIAFHSDRSGNRDIFIMDLDSGKIIQVTTDPGEDFEPTWSFDLKWIAFASERVDGKPEVFLRHLESGEEKQLTHGRLAKSGLPSFYPNNNRIAYSSNRFVGWNVYAMDIEGSNDKRLSFEGGNCRPDVSIDGHIVFITNRSDKKGDVWRMGPEGEHPVQITFSPARDYDPAWSSDGKWITFYSDRDGNNEIYICDLEGKNMRRVTDHPASDVFSDWHCIQGKP